MCTYNVSSFPIFSSEPRASIRLLLRYLVDKTGISGSIMTMAVELKTAYFRALQYLQHSQINHSLYSFKRLDIIVSEISRRRSYQNFYSSIAVYLQNTNGCLAVANRQSSKVVNILVLTFYAPSMLRCFHAAAKSFKSGETPFWWYKVHFLLCSGSENGGISC